MNIDDLIEENKMLKEKLELIQNNLLELINKIADLQKDK